MNCPCGEPVEYDADNGYQHLDGSVSHDNGKTVSQMLDECGLPKTPQYASVKSEWEKAHAERGGYFPHEFAGEQGGLTFPRCGVCNGRLMAGEHMAYEEAQRVYAEANVPRHHFIPKKNKRTGRCTVCGMPSASSLHDAASTPVSPPAPELQAAAAKLHCADCGADYFADNDEDIAAHKASHDPEAAAYTGSGCMVAIYPTPEGLAGLKTAGDLPLEAKDDMHVTLAYMPTTPEGDRLELLKSVVADMARTQGPLTGVWGGTARFNPSEGSDGKPVLVALPDLPDLSGFRQSLVDALDAAGFEVATNHGYTPHLTVAYDDNGQVRAEGPLTFPQLTLAAAGGRFSFDLTAEIDTDPETAEADTFTEMGKIAQGIDAAVDDALTHLRSCADLPPYALQAQAVLQGIDPACDMLLDFFGVSDADDDPQADSEQSSLLSGLLERAKQFGEARGLEMAAMVQADKSAEVAQIDLNKKTTHSQGAHPYLPSMYQAPPRCLMCGSKEPDQGIMCAGLGTDGVGEADPVRPDPLIMASLTSVRDRAFVEAEARELPKERAFLTEVAGRTILTGPASVMGIEKAMTPNEHFLWVQGRFVGAEKANRNGAFWTTADLEMGEPTVRYGPLNWLHEAKHIIGTLADQRLVQPTAEQAAEGSQPHIWTLSPIWKWVYPDEAYVVEQASDAGKLWYSMECVSKDVECVGDAGCGAKVPYMDYLQAAKASWTGRATKACEHMRQKSADRRFAEPTFLGGAVIVPPVRPGWADADASVLRQAAAMSEKAFEDAGQPDMTATEWEYVMADVLRFASL